MLPKQAFDRLVAAGYLTPRDLGGWFCAEKPPTKADLAWYVRAVKTLGAWAMPQGAGTPLVELSMGDRTDEILFRLSKEIR
jgi:hypothetical protein